MGAERTAAERAADEASQAYRQAVMRNADRAAIEQARARREKAWRAVRIEREKGR